MKVEKCAINFEKPGPVILLNTYSGTISLENAELLIADDNSKLEIIGMERKYINVMPQWHGLDCEYEFELNSPKFAEIDFTETFNQKRIKTTTVGFFNKKTIKIIRAPSLLLSRTRINKKYDVYGNFSFVSEIKEQE
jgi:hypothetical protein